MNTTKYIRGFPVQVEISDYGMDIDGIERLIVALDGTEFVHKFQKESLMKTYRQVRAKYWDDLFVLDDEKKTQINELGMWVIGIINRMYVNRERLKKLELDKMACGKTHAARINLRMFIKNPMKEEECSFEKALCQVLYQFPERIPIPYNIYRSETFISTDDDFRCCDMDINNEYFAKLQKDGINNMAHQLKEDFQLAWKDLVRINEWGAEAKYYFKSI